MFSKLKSFYLGFPDISVTLKVHTVKFVKEQCVRSHHILSGLIFLNSYFLRLNKFNFQEIQGSFGRRKDVYTVFISFPRMLDFFFLAIPLLRVYISNFLN